MLPHALKAIPEVERFYSWPSIESTNDAARSTTEFPGRGIFVFQADRQTQGRGRRGTPWFSDCEEGLWATILARLDERHEHFAHNRALSCAICDAVASITGNAVSCEIKWPNDILIRGKKVCGILLESHTVQRDLLALGFGINVNTGIAAFPPELRPLATSLFIETGKRFSLSRLLELIVGNYCAFRERDTIAMHRVYSNRLYGLGRRISVDGVSGTFDGVETDGRLRCASGARVTHVVAGHVSFYDQEE